MAHLRTARQMRQAKGGTTKSGLGQIVDTVSIRERPAEAEDRAVPGHWEGDLLSGANNTHIVTLVERHTRFAMLLKVPSKDTATVVGALGKHVRKLPQRLRRSLTWDRGKEMADHKSFTIATNVQVYFCDPRSPWQRGSNENTNGLTRLRITTAPSSSTPWFWKTDFAISRPIVLTSPMDGSPHSGSL
jgi:IS30 family transposase